MKPRIYKSQNRANPGFWVLLIRDQFPTYHMTWNDALSAFSDYLKNHEINY